MLMVVGVDDCCSSLGPSMKTESVGEDPKDMQSSAVVVGTLGIINLYRNSVAWFDDTSPITVSSTIGSCSVTVTVGTKYMAQGNEGVGSTTEKLTGTLL
jgi:hypothetical protein